MKTFHNNSMNKTQSTKQEFLITSVNTQTKILSTDFTDINSLTQNKLSTNIYKKLDKKFTLPNLSNNISMLKTSELIMRKNSPKHTKINLKKMQNFIKPPTKYSLEKNKLNELKKRLIQKKFKELHNYKLKINPDNIFHDYGLSKYIKINSTSNFKNKCINRYHNNISSYNRTKTEEKKNGIDLLTKTNLKIRKNKTMESVQLENIPSKNTNTLYNFIFKTFSINDKKSNFLENAEDKNEILGINDSMFRKQNINDFVETSSTMYFFKEFKKKSKTMGKLVKNYNYN